MLVRFLRLRNFRNYSVQETLLPTGLVALIGDNGQGKTNFLEALCVLATTKSPLVERDRELVRWGETQTAIAAEIELSRGRGEKFSETRRLEYSWRVEPGERGAVVSREMRAGGVPQSQIAEWLGQLQVVAFFPHDLELIAGEPEARRKFLNLELGKTRPAHFADAARYRRALKQRNALLRHLGEPHFRTAGVAENLGTLAEWNRQIVSYGARILAQREQFLQELAPLLDLTHRELSGRDERFAVEYVPGLRKLSSSERNEPGAQTNWSRRLAASLEADHEGDLRRAMTNSGPHRDDLTFRLGDMDLRRYGSQGQQRLAVLALKIGLAHWVEAATGEAPVLLLDDALSELDATRRERLLQQALRFPQSVLSATDARFVGDVPATTLAVAGGRFVAL